MILSFWGSALGLFEKGRVFAGLVSEFEGGESWINYHSHLVNQPDFWTINSITPKSTNPFATKQSGSSFLLHIGPGFLGWTNPNHVGNGWVGPFFLLDRNVQLRFFGLPPLQSLCHWFPSMNIRIRILPRFGGVPPTEARKMCDPLQTWNLQEKGSRLEEKLQIVRYHRYPLLAKV